MLKGKGERGKGCGIRRVKGKGKESFMRISSNYEPFPLFSFPLGPSQICEVFKKTDGEISVFWSLKSRKCGNIGGFGKL